MKYLNEIAITGKKILVRVDFNVPIIDGEIQNYFRLDSVYETINYCISQKARVILITHIGRPNGKCSEELSVFPFIDYLEKKYNTFVHYSDDCISDKSFEVTNNMLPEEIHLLENLRFYSEETDNDLSFASTLSKHADIYVNDAFGTSHRSHASNDSILSFISTNVLGFLFKKELKYFYSINSTNKKSCTLVVGGAKVSSKMKMLTHFLNKSDNILIGGGMAYTFLKAKGYSIGNSLYENEMVDFAKALLEMADNCGTNIILPVDTVCSKELNDSGESRTCYVDDIHDDEMGLDIGPETCSIFEEVLNNSVKVIWNGPLGAFEYLNFSTGTHFITSVLRDLTLSSKLISIVGGGDTVSAIQNSGTIDGFTHISTGGGAALKLLSGESLNIIEKYKLNEKK